MEPIRNKRVLTATACAKITLFPNTSASSFLSMQLSCTPAENIFRLRTS